MSFFKRFTGKKNDNDNDNIKNTPSEHNSEEILGTDAEKSTDEASIVPNSAQENINPGITKKAQEIIDKAQVISKDPNAQIRFVVEHKILPSKIIADPVYTITSIISENGSYINNFYKGLYAQNNLDEQYTAEDFLVSAPYKLGGAMVIKICMPDKNLFPSLCKRIYIAYNEHFTKHLYVTVESITNGEYKMATWIDGEHEEFGKIEDNEEEMLKNIIEDEEIYEAPYSNYLQKLMQNTTPNPSGVITNPEEASKYLNAYKNTLMRVQKLKQEDKRDEALKLIRELIKKEAVKYNNTDDLEFHCFASTFDVVLYANLYHPYNPVTHKQKQFAPMQVDLSAAYLLLGAMMLEKQQYDKAIDIIWKAIDANPVNVQLLFALADAYKGKGYYKTFYEIIKLAHVCAVNKTDIARIYRNFALYYIQIKEYETAAALCYASKYFDSNLQSFNIVMNVLKEASQTEYTKPSLEFIKKKLAENGIAWGAKELVKSVINLLNNQFTSMNNKQGIELCQKMLAEVTLPA